MTRWWHRPLAASGAVASMVGCSQPAPTAQRSRAPETAPSAPSADAAASAGAGSGDLASSLPAPATTTTLLVTTTSTLVLAPAVVLTVPLPEDEDEDLTDEEWWEAQPGYQPSTRDALLACIRSYEQGAAGYATDTRNGFYGAYQFTLGTWRSVGGTGNPAHASPAEQDERAWALYLSRGLAPWPTPARRCG